MQRKKKISKKGNNNPKRTTIKWLWIVAMTPVAILALMLTLTSLGAFGRMPSFEELENPKSNLATEIYADNGEVIGSFFVQNRSYVQYDELFPQDSTALLTISGPPRMLATTHTRA